MRVATLLWAMLACTTNVYAATFYVVPDPSKDAAGNEKAQPSGRLCTVIELAKDGDTIELAEGTYTLPASCLVSKRRISLLGGFKTDFSSRDVFVNITRLTGPGTLLRADSAADDLLVEGIMFDGGTSSAFGNALCPDCFTGPYDSRSYGPLVLLDQTGRARFRSVIFANAPGGAINATLRSALTIEGASIVNSRPFGIHVSGACGYAAPHCVELLIRQSTFIWTWREGISDGTLGGSAIVVGSGVSARIEKSVIAYGDKAAVELETEKDTEVTLQQIVTFDNRGGDVLVAGANKPLADVSPTSRMERLALPWDVTYLNRYLARSKERFYGARIPQNRVFMLSPSAEGLNTPSGSRMTYDAAVLGTVQTAQQAPPPPPQNTPPPPPDKKKGKKKGKR